MKCEEVHERLAEYWDLPEQDERRLELDLHFEHCASCKQEFTIWQESTELIRNEPSLHGIKLKEDEPFRISQGVMEQIYAAESWKKPITERIYNLPYTLRRNLTIVFALCLSLFAFGFIFALLFDHTSITPDSSNGIVLQDVASASGSGNGESKLSLAYATASISEPLLLSTGFLHTYPDYLIVLSLLGFAVILLIMNWINNIRA